MQIKELGTWAKEISPLENIKVYDAFRVEGNCSIERS